jgi:hypothetical protein
MSFDTRCWPVDEIMLRVGLTIVRGSRALPQPPLRHTLRCPVRLWGAEITAANPQEIETGRQDQRQNVLRPTPEREAQGLVELVGRPIADEQGAIGRLLRAIDILAAMEHPRRDLNRDAPGR